MRIRDVRDSDRDRILDFCRDTFSWGDYVDLVWDRWMREKNLLCAYDGAVPAGICHALVSEPAGQLWIEGLRIHPRYRRRHIATELVLHCERIGARRRCTSSLMLVEGSNASSLRLAEKLGYVRDSAWAFYSPGRAAGRPGDARVLSPGDCLPRSLFGLWFVDSWRWHRLDENRVPGLLRDGRIVCSQGSGFKSVATVIPSGHFDSTCLATVLRADRAGARNIVSFLQDYAAQRGISRLQLLANQNIGLEVAGAPKRLVFYLLQKRIGAAQPRAFPPRSRLVT